MIEIIIYADIIILENLIMNFIILLATGIILKIKLSYLRIILASLVGSIYVVLEYIFKLNVFSNILAKFILSLIIIFIAYYPQNIKSLWKEIITFYLTTFTFGGVSTYLINTVKSKNLITKTGIYYGPYVIGVIFIGAIIGTTILILAFKISKNKFNKSDVVCKIRIKLNKKEKTLNAIVDTGNMLKEPITQTPVAVIEKEALIGILPAEILENIDSILGGDFTKISKENQNKYISKLKIIPFASLGKENGMLLGIKPEKIEIIEKTNEEKNAIIGIYNKSLTTSGEYQALIGMDLY